VDCDSEIPAAVVPPSPKLYRRAKTFLLADKAFSRIIFNSGWLLGGSSLTKALSLLQNVIVARILGPKQFGILALITTYSAVVGEFVDSRVWEAAIKYVVQFNQRGDNRKATATVKLCYLVDAASAAVAFIVLLSFATLVARIFVKDPSQVHLIQLYASSVLLTIPIGTATSIVRITDHFSWLAYQGAASVILRLLGVLVVAAMGYGLSGILLVYLAATLLSSIIMVLCSHSATKDLNLTRWRDAPLNLLRNDYREILRFMLYSNISGTSRIITSRADILVLGWFSTPALVGVYKLARSIADAVATLFNPIYVAVYPELSKLTSQENVKEIRSLQKKLSGTIAMIILPLGLCISIGAAWFVPRLFGVDYAESVRPTQILVWQIVWTPLIWVPGYFLSTGRAHLLAAVNALDAINYLFLLLILTPMFGMTGTAVAVPVRFLLWLVLIGWIFLRVDRKHALLDPQHN
jgi:O-antigen/teichoic acid export membrane protein